MKSYQTVLHDIKYTESELNAILYSDSFETAVRTLAERNPYYTRHLLKEKYPMQIVYELCNLAYHVDSLFEDNILSEGWSDIQHFKQVHDSDFQMHKEKFYQQFVLDDEPLPLEYDSVEKALQEINVNLGPKQKQSLYKLIGDVSEEECNELINKCREDVALFGWFNLKNEPLYKQQDDFNLEELALVQTYIKNNRRYILDYYTNGKTSVEHLAKSTLGKIIKKTATLLQQYFPLTSEADIETFVMYHTVIEGQIDVIGNARQVLNYISQIIKYPKRRQYYYEELMSQIKLSKQ